MDTTHCRIEWSSLNDAMTFNEISEIAMSAPGVESGLISQTRAKDHLPHTRAPGAQTFAMRDTMRVTYRAFIVTDKLVDPDDKMRGKIHHDASGESLLDCVREAFEKCGLEVPFLLRPKTTKIPK